MTPRGDADPSDTLPLRDRMPDYLALFGIGVAGAIFVGVLVVALSDHSFGNGFGYALVGLGTVLLLAGGVSGGGYTNLGVGAFGTMFGAGVRTETGSADDPEKERLRAEVFGKKADAHERLRRGLRPEANPRAFWQVVAGSLYFLIGLAVVLSFG